MTASRLDVAADTRPERGAHALHRQDAWALLVLRLGLASVMLWFGIAELHDPASWAVFVPHFLDAWRDPLMLVHASLLLGTGAFLLVGLFQRLAAALAGLLLLAVLGSLLANGAVDSVFVRDIGLATAAAALALSPSAARVASVDRYLADAGPRRRLSSTLSYTAVVIAVAVALASTSVPAAGPGASAFHDLGGVGGALGGASGGGLGGHAGVAPGTPSGAAGAAPTAPSTAPGAASAAGAGLGGVLGSVTPPSSP
jgi:uncharacterized membrane protein YphA (DoxX/SURF4 family)